ncbi:MAG: hypothetical protein HRU26_08950 [Psychroserpens sp.]|nr:hypothetical protein [Psychroserpens sp.]
MTEINKTVLTIVAAVILATGGWAFHIDSQVTSNTKTINESKAELSQLGTVKTEVAILGKDNGRFERIMEKNTEAVTELKIVVEKILEKLDNE